MSYNVAVDVGGTFTDVLVFDESSGELTEGKVLTTPDDPSEGVVSGIESVCAKVGISFTDLNLLFHGTTVVTNAILTNTGSRVGLITTRGHEENLLLARPRGASTVSLSATMGTWTNRPPIPSVKASVPLVPNSFSSTTATCRSVGNSADASPGSGAISTSGSRRSLA